MRRRYTDAHIFSYRTDVTDPTGLASRFWGVYSAEGGSTTVGTPYGCFDGCREIFHGGKSEAEYDRLFTSEFNDRRRDAPLVGIDAYWQPGEGDTVEVQVDIRNVSETEFDPFTAQQPGLYFVFYDERKELYVEGTGRYGRRVPLIDVLPPGGSMSMDVTLEDVTGFDMDERTLKLIVWLDFRTEAERWEVANTSTAVQGERPAPPGAPPVVSLVRPTDGQEFVIGDIVTIEAEAADPDGDLVKVDFFVGTAKIGEATAPPWIATWEAAGTGMKAIEAHARDRAGWTGKSAPISIRVRLTRPPTETPDPSEPTPPPPPPTDPPPDPTEGPGPDPDPTVDAGGPRDTIFMPLTLKAYAMGGSEIAGPSSTTGSHPTQ